MNAITQLLPLVSYNYNPGLRGKDQCIYIYKNGSPSCYNTTGLYRV